MTLIGYARVSTDEQSTEAQKIELRAAGVLEIHEEHASGASRSRPVLKMLLRKIKAGDTLVVVRIDRLARSLSHLLDVVEGLEEKGAHFRSLNDPIDTGSPQGRFTLQIMGAMAELERSLIRERTTAGLKAARAEGRVGGNPAMKAGDQSMIRKIQRRRKDSFIDGLVASAPDWSPLVRRLRPHTPWEAVVAQVNKTAEGPSWTRDRLVRAVKTLCKDGLMDEAVLGRAPARQEDSYLIEVVCGMQNARPDMSLREIASKLTAMRISPPRRGAEWQPSSVSSLLAKGRAIGMIQISQTGN